jgi:hypothetical protein
LRQSNPSAYREYLRIENIVADYRQRMKANPNARLVDENGTITIPVVFHIIHRGEAIGTGTNIPDARIIDQVAVLNECFSQTNIDQNLIPQVFLNVAGNPNLRFELACVDPNGNNTSGIIRRQSATTNFTAETQNVKITNLGGDDPWPTDRYLNVWVAPNLFADGDQLFGYGQFPFVFAQSPSTDGVAVTFDVVGRNAGNAGGRQSGRTLVHEIGHWLNVFHLFDFGCETNDLCADTPSQQFRTPENAVCPLPFPRNANICNNSPNGDMYHNFMDGTNEACGRRMFTRDQAIRMRAVFQPGGARRGFIDNYFKMLQSQLNCSTKFYGLRTAFCASMGNINWSVTGSATLASYSGFTYSIASLNAPPSGSAVGVITASWGNFTDAIPYVFGYGTESSYIVPTCNNEYTTSFPVRDGTNTIVCPNSYMTGELLFTGATGPATSITLTSTNSSYVYFNASGNNFTLYISDPYAYAQIQAIIPTTCGSKTVNYTFFANIPNAPNYYRISPNPANNEITISASMPVDPNNRTPNSASTPAYEVQIFNSYSQLLKKTKVKKDDRDVTIDVSGFPSNQFYTVKLISNNDVQTKSFFKQ